MAEQVSKLQIFKAILANPQLIKVHPSLNLFFLNYLRKFKIKNIDGNLIIHSHLPPINSRAYSRFINEHLLQHTTGPSHAQIGLTNGCPQNCVYCYNKTRSGKVMNTEMIIKTIKELKSIGMFWLGFTGGEPLLNKDIVRITERAADGCMVKLFTTGCTLTTMLAHDLKNAGLLYVSVSLDHWKAEIHDRLRRYQGAFNAALKAIEIFKNMGNIHVSVSAVLSPEMIRKNEVEPFLEFLETLDIHEAWLSESKPSLAEFWNENSVITETDRLKLFELQDSYNKTGNITINYLGHFEGKEHFGCNAGHKMVYVDAFGEVSPCVFTPMSFGNVHDASVQEIFIKMKKHFPSQDCCFMNRNYHLFNKYMGDGTFLNPIDSERLVRETAPGSYSRFFQLYYR